MKPRVKLIQDIAKENTEESHQKNKEFYDRKGTEIPKFKVGDLVYLKRMHYNSKIHKGKFLKPYIETPFYITQISDKNWAILRSSVDDKPLKNPVSVDRLKMCQNDNDVFHSKVAHAKQELQKKQNENAMNSRINRNDQHDNISPKSSKRPNRNEIRLPDSTCSQNHGTERLESQQRKNETNMNTRQSESGKSRRTRQDSTRTEDDRPDTNQALTGKDTNQTKPKSEWKEIEGVIGRKGRAANMRFQVKWKDGSTTWERPNNVSSFAKSEFYRIYGNKVYKKKRRTN